MVIKTALIPYHTFSSDLFSASVYLAHQKTTIDMSVLGITVNTLQLPKTYQILKEQLPSILASKCFNDKGLPFRKEVYNTEIGHLFEHIMLEYLCDLKSEQGFSQVEYRGVTDWNWKVDEMGTFHISINSGIEDKNIIKGAFEKSIQLIRIILRSNTHYKSRN